YKSYRRHGAERDPTPLPMETDRCTVTGNWSVYRRGGRSPRLDQLDRRQGVHDMASQKPRPTIHVPGTTSHSIAPRRHDGSEGTLRYLKAGTGAPLVLLHTVRTQAEHFRSLIP